MRKDIRPINDNWQAHGLWERYNYNGKLWHKRFYHNGKILGYEEWNYYSDGKLTKKKYNI